MESSDNKRTKTGIPYEITRDFCASPIADDGSLKGRENKKIALKLETVEKCRSANGFVRRLLRSINAERFRRVLDRFNNP